MLSAFFGDANLKKEVTLEHNEMQADQETAKPLAGETANEDLDRVRAERDGFKVERDELKDLLLRRQAEFDNYRKRSERERADYVQYAATDLIKALLPVLDDFERALKVEAPNSDYAKGVEMIYSRMFETMKKLGLEPIESAGKPFDPHVHQAIERVETADAVDNTVLGEFQRGYFFKGRLLRPAMVKVAVKP
ncbi:MAG TPA: nucleotide exchange factor GrpE [Bryobacteraceae bacterium]|nr:nucleotide exchange factor GrpE [Bryobacteraceae bacterium]